MKEFSKSLLLILFIVSCSNNAINNENEISNTTILQLDDTSEKDNEFCSDNFATFTSNFSDKMSSNIEKGISKKTLDKYTNEVPFLSETIEKWIGSRDGQKEITELITKQIKFLNENPNCEMNYETTKELQDWIVEDGRVPADNQLALDWLTMGSNIELLKQYKSLYEYEYEFYSSLISTHIDNGQFAISRFQDSDDILGRFGYLDVLLFRETEFSAFGLNSDDQLYAEDSFKKGIIRIYDGVIVDSQGIMKQTLETLEQDGREESGVWDRIKDYFSIDDSDANNLYRSRLIDFYITVSKEPMFSLFMDNIYSNKTDRFSLDYANNNIFGQINGNINGKTYECDVSLEIIESENISREIFGVSSEDYEVNISNIIPDLLKTDYLGNFWEGNVCNEEVIIAPTPAGYIGSGKKENTYFMLPILIYINHIDSVLFNHH